MQYGYARVSTQDQETYLQLDALKRAKCREIVSEKASGVSERPELKKLLQKMQQGDTLLVYKFDRLGRSLSDLLKLIDALAVRGIGLKSLTEPIDTSSAIGKLLFQQLGAFAEFERGLIRERSIAGQQAAKKRGVHCGRPSTLTAEQRADVRTMYAGGFFTHASLAIIFECHPSVIKRVLYSNEQT